MSGIRWQSRLTQYCDDNANPLSDGTLTFSISGTSTPANTYNAPDLMDANVNPITLDADGRLPVDVFLDPAVTYRVILKNSAGSNIAQDDPVAGSDITAAIEAHNDDLSAHYAATESQRGFVELGNQTEINTDDPLKVVTGATLGGRTATTTRTGVIKSADSATTITGTATDSAVTPAAFRGAITGTVVNFARTNSSTKVTGQTATIPNDNTIPQITEGTEYFTVSITPKYATSLLRVRAFLPLVSYDGASDRFIGAIFRDSTADALVTSVAAHDVQNGGASFLAEIITTANAATATTFRLRYGGYAGTGVSIGYGDGAQRFSTSTVACITVEEIAQ